MVSPYSSHPEHNQTPTTWHPPFFWSIMTSPLCLITIAGYTMLLISPKTRVLAGEFLDLLKYLAISLFEFLWSCRGYPSTAYVELLKQSWSDREAQLTRERDQAINIQRDLATEKAEVESRIKTITEDNGQLHLALRTHKARLSYYHRGEAESDLGKENKRLNEVINDMDSQMQIIQARDTRIHELEQTLSSTTAQLCDAQNHIEEAEIRERANLQQIDQLSANLAQQVSAHQHSTFQKDQQLVLHNSVMEVLHTLASQTDREQLSTAVLFAKAIQLAGINLTALGIDQRRFELLCDYVRGDMRSDLAVQPQATEHGFRLKKPYMLNDVQGQNTTVNCISGPYQQSKDSGYSASQSISPGGGIVCPLPTATSTAQTAPAPLKSKMPQMSQLYHEEDEDDDRPRKKANIGSGL